MPRDSVTFDVDGQSVTGTDGEPLPEALAAAGIGMPRLCYHPSLGPIQTCDACFIEVNGDTVRGCSVVARDDLNIRIHTKAAREARGEGIDRVVANHDLYCSVCDNNNGNCDVHNAVRDMGVSGQHYPYRGKPYDTDETNPFYLYDPDQCILCGRCVEACQNLQVNETLSIDWTRDRPRVIWDDDVAIEDSSCVSCGHCVTVCPCNALMEKSMIGRAAIDIVKAVEPTTGFKPIFAASEVDAAMRGTEQKRTKTVCTYCGVGCSFEMWTRGREILKVEPKKELAVKLERVDNGGPPPLAPNDPRHATPNPKSGVEVQHKWARDDYTRPPKPLPSHSGL